MIAVAFPLAAGDVPLFPTPLHLVRRVDDPISKTTSRVDEYCIANRIITIDGYKTVVVDYSRQDVLQIDRATSTYSVARFDEIAAANALTAPPPARIAAGSTLWKTTALGMRRGGDAFEIISNNLKIELIVDRQNSLSRKAFDALTGASNPNRASAQQDAIARASARAADTYGIPLEQSITFDAGASAQFTMRNAVTRIDNDLPPPELLAIPAGATLVPSRAARLRKSLEELKDPAPHP